MNVEMQTHPCNIAGQNLWMFTRLASEFGLSSTCDALMVGDRTGAETDDFLTLRPNANITIKI